AVLVLSHLFKSLPHQRGRWTIDAKVIQRLWKPLVGKCKDILWPLEVILTSPITIRRSSILTFFLIMLPLAVISAAARLISAVQSDNLPQARSDSYCASPGNELKVTAALGVLANDTGTPLTVVGNSTPANGAFRSSKSSEGLRCST